MHTLRLVTTPAVPWLDEREMTAWRSYIETVVDLNAALEADLAEHGMTLGDYQVLVFLSEADGRSMRMCDLADRLQLSPSGATRRLDGLVRDGFVERRPSTTDRRVMLAMLTPSGYEHLSAVAPHHVRSVRHRVLDWLTPSDVDALGRIFTRIRAALGTTRAVPPRR